MSVNPFVFLFDSAKLTSNPIHDQ